MFWRRMTSLLTAAVSVLLACGSMLLSGCEEKPPALPWETPLGYDERLEKHYGTYVNDTYRYAFNYPADLLDALEENDQGFAASGGDGYSLKVWAQKNTEGLTLEEAFQQATDSTGGYTSGRTYSHSLAFNFDDPDNPDRVGYYYTLSKFGNLYTFDFRYPKTALEEGKSLYSAMVKRYVLYQEGDLTDTQINHIRKSNDTLLKLWRESPAAGSKPETVPS